jgi:hypothetical protein
VALGVAGAVGVWQLSFVRDADRLNAAYRQRASVGLCTDMPAFFPFFYYFGLFPVAGRTVFPALETREDFADFIKRHPERLIMDFSGPCNTARYGDYGKIFLFLPATLAGGSAAKPSVRLFNVLFFIVALEATLLALWREGYPMLGTLLAVLIGSHPLQLYEVYAHENVFSMPISTALLMLALHARFLTGRAAIDRTAGAVAIASGVILASIRQVRTEPALMALALPLVYLTIPRERLPKRLALILALALGYALTAQAWRVYFDRKIQEATAFVAAAGGDPYTGPRSQYHTVWHNLFLGLGDFDTERGYRWDDLAGYRYAIPILQREYGRPVTWQGSSYYLDQSYDARGQYMVSPLDFPEYYDVLRAKVTSDVRHDPLWYIGILWKRVEAIMSGTTPASLAGGAWRVGVPLSGWLVLPTLVAALLGRRPFFVKLLWFTFPLSLTPLFIFSGRGTTHYALFHLMMLAVWVQALVDAIGRRRAPAATQEEPRSRARGPLAGC